MSGARTITLSMILGSLMTVSFGAGNYLGRQHASVSTVWTPQCANGALCGDILKVRSVHRSTNCLTEADLRRLFPEMDPDRQSKVLQEMMDPNKN